MFRSVAVSCAALALSSTTFASINGFNESFAGGAANWRNFNGTATLGWTAAGGPSDAAFVTGQFNLANTTVGGFPPTVMRAAASYGSSNGGYVGNWIDAGVTNVGFWFRHDLSQSIVLTGRFATPTNSPGASVVSFAPIAANTWTYINFNVAQGSSDIISLGGGTYSAIFSNIGNIQLGFQVPAALAGQNITGSFDMTGFNLTPAPGAVALLAAGGLVRSRRR
ncbi:MAG: hypothetical protein FJ270_09555 [Planctomycetes bacterium]|nr:hypothetical protein [Planctomycetota bacterium]